MEAKNRELNMTGVVHIPKKYEILHHGERDGCFLTVIYHCGTERTYFMSMNGIQILMDMYQVSESCTCDICRENYEHHINPNQMEEREKQIRGDKLIMRPNEHNLKS